MSNIGDRRNRQREKRSLLSACGFLPPVKTLIVCCTLVVNCHKEESSSLQYVATATTHPDITHGHAVRGSSVITYGRIIRSGDGCKLRSPIRCRTAFTFQISTNYAIYVNYMHSHYNFSAIINSSAGSMCSYTLHYTTTAFLLQTEQIVC